MGLERLPLPAPVCLANTRTFFKPSSIARDPAAWQALLVRWYGERYGGGFESLERLSGPPWLYASWRTPGWETDQFSWVLTDPRLRALPIAQDHRYVLYRLDLSPW